MDQKEAREATEQRTEVELLLVRRRYRGKLYPIDKMYQYIFIGREENQGNGEQITYEVRSEAELSKLSIWQGEK